MLGWSRASAALLFATACASSGGTRHKLGSIEVLVAGEEGESSDRALPVVPAWMLKHERPGDEALWTAYAERVLPAIARDPTALPNADAEARAEMAKQAPGLGAGVTSRYLREQLPAIAAAGFVAEHAALELEGGGASVKPPPEREEAYLLWRAEALPEMVPETEVAFLAGRRKVSRHAVPWATAVLGLTGYLARALEKDDCAAVDRAARALLASWARVSRSGVALSMEGDQRHLAWLKTNVTRGEDLHIHPIAYREAALASAACARTEGRTADAVSRATTATEMDPLCGDCWIERALAHRAANDQAGFAAAKARALAIAETDEEKAAVNQALEASR